MKSPLRRSARSANSTERWGQLLPSSCYSLSSQQLLEFHMVRAAVEAAVEALANARTAAAPEGEGAGEDNVLIDFG